MWDANAINRKNIAVLSHIQQAYDDRPSAWVVIIIAVSENGAFLHSWAGIGSC
jgi:hypothetical protein